MIFTPEEARDIAESMFKWKFEDRYENPANHPNGDVYFGEGWWNGNKEEWIPNDGLDFSQPEWTGAMLEAIHKISNEDHYANVRIRNVGTSVETYDFSGNRDSADYTNGNLNRNLYDAWRWLKNKEASDVKD